MSRSRRAVLSAVGAGCTALAGRSAVTGLAGATHERSDLEPSLATECRPEGNGGAGSVALTLSWTWTGNGGSDPPDAVVPAWPDEDWTLVEPAEGTTETVRFEHDDVTAEADTTYGARWTLSPRADAAGDGRTVAGRFANVHSDADGPREGGLVRGPRRGVDGDGGRPGRDAVCGRNVAGPRRVLTTNPPRERPVRS